MARNKGKVTTVNNYQIKLAEAIDPRVTVSTKAELFLQDTWPNDGGAPYLYNGLIVGVVNEQAAYMLVNRDNYNSEAGWKRIDGSQGGTSGGSGEIVDNTFIIEYMTVLDLISVTPDTSLQCDCMRLADAIDSYKAIYIRFDVENELGTNGTGLIPCVGYREDVYYVSFNLGDYVYGFSFEREQQEILASDIWHEVISGSSENQSGCKVSIIKDFTTTEVDQAYSSDGIIEDVDTISIVESIENNELLCIYFDTQKQGIIPCNAYYEDAYYISFIADDRIFKLVFDSADDKQVRVYSIDSVHSGGVGPVASQSDWNINNANNPSYIKNRTHYKIEDISYGTSMGYGDSYYNDDDTPITPNRIRVRSEEGFVSDWINVYDGYGEYFEELYLYDEYGDIQDTYSGDITVDMYTSGVELSMGTAGYYVDLDYSTIKKLSEEFIPDTIARKSDLENNGGGSITVDSTLSTSSTNPVQNKVITTELNELSQETNKISNIINGKPQETLEWQVEGYYGINDTVSEGDVVDINVRQHSVYRCLMVECSEGDTFLYTGRNGSFRPYAFLDSQHRLLGNYGTLGTKYKNEQITAPQDSAYVIMQTLYSEWEELGSLPCQRQEREGIEEGVKKVKDAVLVTPNIRTASESIQALSNLNIQSELINNVCTVGNFEDSSLWNTPTPNMTLTIVDGVVKMTSSAASGNSYSEIRCSNFGWLVVPQGKKAFISIKARTNIDNIYFKVQFNSAVGFMSLQSETALNKNSIWDVCCVEYTAQEETKATTFNWGFTKISANIPSGGWFEAKDLVVGIYDIDSEMTIDSFAKLTRNIEWFVGNRVVPNADILLDLSSATLHNDITVSVGSDGDFQTISAAMAYLSQCYPMYKYGGVKAEIRILNGTTITDQVLVVGADYSWITITYEGYNPNSFTYDDVAESIANGSITFDTTNGYNSVPVDASSWTAVTHDTRGDVVLFRAEDGGRLPKIQCVFKLINKGEKDVAGVCCNRGSSCVVATLCGFIGFNDGVIANNESSITIREGITMNCGRWGCHARHNGEVSARSVIAVNCATDAKYSGESAALCADRIADLDGREAWVSCGNAFAVNNTSRINCNGTHVLGSETETAIIKATAAGVGNFTSLFINAGVKIEYSQGATITVSNYTFRDEYTFNIVTSNGVIYNASSQGGSGGEGGSITVDSALSDTSTNPVQNKVIATALTELSAEVGKKQDTITDLEAIRSGASKGATALQSVPDTYATKTYVDNAIKDIPQGGGEPSQYIKDATTSADGNTLTLTKKDGSIVSFSPSGGGGGGSSEPSGILAALYRNGVISQDLNREGNANIGYKSVVSNPVYGVIPKQFIDQVWDQYAVRFNEQTGYFEYADITNLAYDEVMHSVSLCNGLLIGTDQYRLDQPTIFFISGISKGGNYDKKLRTLLIPRIYVSGDWDLPATLPNRWKIQLSKNDLFLEIGLNSPLFPAAQTSMMCYMCQHLRKAGNFYFDTNANMNNSFAYCYSLEEIGIKALSVSLDFRWSPLLKNECILFMIQNASKTGITITLHPTAYDRAMADSEIVAAMETKQVNLAKA